MWIMPSVPRLQPFLLCCADYARIAALHRATDLSLCARAAGDLIQLKNGSAFIGGFARSDKWSGRWRRQHPESRRSMA